MSELDHSEAASQIPVPEELRQEIEAAIEKYPHRRSAVIPSLHAAQAHYGWCSPKAIQAVAEVMEYTPAFVESIATFYDLFYTEPAGKRKILVCTNLSCMMRGGEKVLARFEEELGVEAGQMSADGEFQLESFECLGACDIAPMASLDGNYRGPIEVDEVPTIIENLRNDREPLEGKRCVGNYGRTLKEEGAK